MGRKVAAKIRDVTRRWAAARKQKGQYFQHLKKWAQECPEIKDEYRRLLRHEIAGSLISAGQIILIAMLYFIATTVGLLLAVSVIAILIYWFMIPFL